MQNDVIEFVSNLNNLCKNLVKIKQLQELSVNVKYILKFLKDK